jgi:hypothetical protein
MREIDTDKLVIYGVLFLFLSLSEDQRRFVVVAVGTVYPLVASTVAITTKTDGKDDTSFWLTYWSCFNLLFWAMGCLEHFVGNISGFYSICLVATIYLFLPLWCFDAFWFPCRDNTKTCSSTTPTSFARAWKSRFRQAITSECSGRLRTFS